MRLNTELLQYDVSKTGDSRSPNSLSFRAHLEDSLILVLAGQCDVNLRIVGEARTSGLDAAGRFVGP